MLRAERYQQIVDFVNKKGIVALEDLMEEVRISKATARRDINDLSAQNLLIKIRGGAKSCNVEATSAEPSFVAKSLVNSEEKQRIALAALEYIHDGDKLMLDSGTTVLELAKLLKSKSHLTVVTNDIRIAAELKDIPDLSLLLIGGMIRKGFCSSYGFFAETMLGNITVSKLFFSVDAIDPEMGLKSYTMDDLNIKKIGIANASERILLCDHSKFQSRAMFSIAGLDAIDTIIVGNELEESIAQKLSHMGKKLLLV